MGDAFATGHASDAAPDREDPRTAEREAERMNHSAQLRRAMPNGDAEQRLMDELSAYQVELATQAQMLHEAQSALEDERARFRELYADAPIGFYVIGIQGRILSCNRRGAELLRLSETTAPRRRLTEFMSVENAERFTRRVTQLYRTRAPVAFEGEIRRADGKTFWAEFTLNLSNAGSDAGTVCHVTLTDITDRKRMQDDTARLAAIVATSSQAIVSQDLDGTIRSWNAGAERLFGIPAAAAIGHNISMTLPPDRMAEEDEIQRQIRRMEHVSLESERIRHDGSRVPVFLSAAPILNSSGRVTGISSIMRDISEQVASRQEVARLLDDLRQADRRKDDFIATLAHELRNPLAPIRNAAAVMRFASNLDPKLQWCRDVIDRQVAHMAALLDDLLDVSRLTRNKITLHRDRVELGTAIAQAVEINRPMIQSCGHKLTVQQPSDPIEVVGDLTRLIQIFGNLLNNAAKYTEPGGEISVSTSVLNGQVFVRVRDTGVGIRAENLSSIFDLFVQVDPAREGSEGGLGIGLALVKGLVERHGGTIHAHSAGLARGSEFTVSLPTAPPLPRTATGDHPIVTASRRNLNRLHVLVVDDNVDAAESLAMILQADQHDVRTAHDGEQAMVMAQEQNPDVMVLDLGMPKMTGYEVARRVREESWGQNIVLIACTGWGQPEDRRRSEQSGFDHHLVKPVSASAVLRLMRSIEPQEKR